MNPDLQLEYDLASIPFIGGAIEESHTKLKSWRYFVELNSGCNLRCPTCTKGNTETVDGKKYDHLNGFMDMDLMERILDKLKAENPEAIVFMYGNSESWLHPKLPECITAIRQRGLNPQMSTNLNYIQRVHDTLAARPEYIIISLSGFTQEVYVRGHAGGDIDKVKLNMAVVSEANALLETPVNIAVNYHVYDYNQHEVEAMREYATKLGFGFFTSIARAISMENAVQYCRSKDEHATPYEVQEGQPDWNHLLPPVTPTYQKTMEHLLVPPTEAREMYKDVPMSRVCPVGAGSLFTFIRHDGKLQLCACTADRRITLGYYMDMTPDEMIEKRTGHSFCGQCMKYRMPGYFMLMPHKKWTAPV